MQQAFLVIIAALGAVYALFTKQGKLALGLILMAVSFAFAITGLVQGVWIDVFGAISMIVFAVSVIVIVYKRKAIEEEAKPQETKEVNEE